MKGCFSAEKPVIRLLPSRKLIFAQSFNIFLSFPVAEISSLEFVELLGVSSRVVSNEGE